MGKCSSYKVVHNGYKIEFMESMQQVDSFMESVISNYSRLNPTKIMDRTLKLSGSKKVRIVRFQYTTLYEEDFIIEYND